MKNVVFLACLLLYGVGMYWLGMRSGHKGKAEPVPAESAEERR